MTKSGEGQSALAFHTPNSGLMSPCDLRHSLIYESSTVMAPPTVSARCATGSAHHSWSRSSPDRQTSTPICYVRSACWRRRSIPCRTIVIVITLRTSSSSSSSAGGNTTQRGRRTTHQPQVCCLHIVCIVFFMSYILQNNSTKNN